MKKHHFIALLVGFSSIISFPFTSCGPINAVHDEHFTDDGVLVQDSGVSLPLQSEIPANVKFYVEVSGSMNGFFRANQPTEFKRDVWEILSYYNPKSVSILTNAGNTGANVPLQTFRTDMNTGAFVSNNFMLCI